MNEHSDRTTESPPTTTQNIASAPGQLAMPEVEARYEAQRWQFRHDNTIAPLSPRPGAPVIVSATSGVEAKVEAACIFYTVDRSVPQTSSIRIPMEISEVTWDSRTGY
jgi:cyclomaltodextrinase